MKMIKILCENHMIGSNGLIVTYTQYVHFCSNIKIYTSHFDFIRSNVTATRNIHSILTQHT